MFLHYLLLLLGTLIWSSHANFIPRAPPNTNTTSEATTTSTRASSVSVPHVQAAASPNADQLCCFVVQDVVSEEWWDIVATSSIYTVINETRITAHLTPYPTTTLTSYEINVYPTNTSFPVTAQVGANPIPLFDNGAPLPTQVARDFNGTALVTGGITVQSPAAFYVYSTVKVIMAAAITDSAGNLACGTALGGFPNMNQNAQAYFDGPGSNPVPPTPTAFRDRARRDQADPVVISLMTPFIYQPARGATGALWNLNTCTETPGTEDFGYVPQTVLDFLVDNKEYSAQYPGLASCLAAGPSIIPAGCGEAEFTTFLTTFTTTPPVSTSISTFTTFHVFNLTTVIPATTVLSFNTIFSTSVITSVIPATTIGGSVSRLTTGNFTKSITVLESSLPESTSVFTTIASSIETNTQTAPPITVVTPSGSPATGTVATELGGQPVLVTSAVTEALAGVGPAGNLVAPTYSSPDVGTGITAPPVTIIDNPQSAQAPLVTPLGNVQVTPPPGGPQSPPGNPPNPVATAVCQIIGGCATGGNNQQIPPPSPGVSVVVPQQTTIPLSAAPLGLQGQITTIGGTPMLVVTSQTFNPFTPTVNSVPGASVTIGPNGSPSIVISSSTLVPLINAPPQLSGAPTTIINNTPFLVVGPTTIAAPTTQANGLITTNIGGTSFIVFPSAPTEIPLSNAPPGLSGSLTIINNTPFIVVPGQTSVQIQATPTGHLLTTTINGTPFVVVQSSTEIPLSNAPSGISGITTTINGTPFLIITSATMSQLPTATGEITSVPGSVTVVNGVTEVIFTGPATIPVNSAFSLSGLTTVISGITEVILSTPTTISLSTSPSSSTGSTLSSTTSTSTSSSRSSTSSKTSSSSSRSSSTSSSTTSSASSSPSGTVLPSNSNSNKGLSTGAKVGIAFAVIIFALLVAGLILWLRRRRQDRQEYAPVAAGGETGPQVMQQQAGPPRQQVGADNYTPVVRTRGGYAPAPQEEWFSALRRERSVARKPVGTG